MVIRLFKVSELSFDHHEDPIEYLQGILDEWDGKSDLNLAWLDDIEVEIIHEPEAVVPIEGSETAFRNLVRLAGSELAAPFRVRETFASIGVWGRAR